MIKKAKGLAILISDKELEGSRLPHWYGFAYREYDVSYTILAIIPLNLLIRYTVKVYWLVYRFIKHDGWYTKLDDAYWRGFNDGNIEKQHHFDRLVRIFRGEE